MSPLAVILFSLFILPLQNYECKDDKPPDHDRLNPEEKQALLDFIDKVPHNFTWDKSQPACDWKGVDCDESNTTVLYLRLPGKSLVGKIPPNTLGKLTNLRVLSLRVNGLSGELPLDFANLTSLTRLSLNDNYFSGLLPDIDAKSLTKLNVSFNLFNSSIPYSFSKFTISSFSQNVFLCGPPTKIICPPSYPSPYAIKHEKPPKQNSIIVYVSVGAAVVLLVLVCCVRKKVYQQTEKPQGKVINNFVVLHDLVHGLDVEDLLKASAVVLGGGSFGRSYKQVLQGKNGTTAVVKRLKDVAASDVEFRAKVEGLGKMKDKNVVRLIAYYCSEDEKWLVYDYMPDGSLYARLHESIASEEAQLDWDRRIRISLGAARGLAYLHEDGISIVHGNIKSSNILLRQESHDTNNIEAYLSDYGLNTLFSESRSLDYHITGYQAPEVHNIREVTFQSDVYSFGVLLLELLSGKNPGQASLVESVASEEPKDYIFDPKLTRGHNIEEIMQLWRIAKKCVSGVPSERPKMCEVVNMMDNMSQSLDDQSKGYDLTPSTDTRDTPSTITP